MHSICWQSTQNPRKTAQPTQNHRNSSSWAGYAGAVQIHAKPTRFATVLYVVTDDNLFLIIFVQFFNFVENCEFPRNICIPHPVLTVYYKYQLFIICLIFFSSEASGDPLGATTDPIPTETISVRSRVPTSNASDLLKDGLSVTPSTEDDAMYKQAENMSSIKPTVWLGAQNGK